VVQKSWGALLADEKVEKQQLMVEMAVEMAPLTYRHRVVRGKSALRKHQRPDLQFGTYFLAECFRRFVC
jgi:hypothetical protein